MLNILSILNFVATSIQKKDPRYEVIDSEHVFDTKTSIRYRLYDDYIKITHGDTVILKMDYLSKQEQQAIWAIKQLITDPAETEAKRANYMKMVQEYRAKFSELYAEPMPVEDNSIQPEMDTEEYTG